MKKMLMVSNGEHVVARSLKATLVLLIGLALVTAFWVASTPSARAAEDKASYLASLCNKVKKDKADAKHIVHEAVSSHRQWENDILRSLFSCVGDKDCDLLSRIWQGAIQGNRDAAALTDLATQLAPTCATSFSAAETGTPDTGNFGNPPGTNLNPPPGSIGGGGGQGNIVAVCLNGQTLFVTPERAQEILNQNPGATLGACQVTSTTNR